MTSWKAGTYVRSDIQERDRHGKEVLTSRRDLLPSSRNANNNTLAPALVARLERRAHHAGIARAIKRVVAPTIRHLNQLVDDRLALGQLGRVDKIRRAKLARPLLLGRVDIHNDDLTRLVGHRALHHAQPNTPGTKHGNVAALLHLGRDARRAVAGRDAAPEQARPIHRRVRLDGHHGDISDNRVLAEGTRAHKMQDVLPARPEPARPVRHHALTLRRANLTAQVRLAALAELALLALGRVQRDDVVPRLDVGDALADRLDDAGALVAENDREGALGVLARQGVGVRVADARVGDLDADLVGLGRRDLDVLVGELLAGAPGDGRLAGDCLRRGQQGSQVGQGTLFQVRERQGSTRGCEGCLDGCGVD